MHALSDWIAQQFQGNDATPGPSTHADVLHATTAVIGQGCDLLGGELPAVHYQYRFPSRGEAQGAIARIVVTDRRLFGRVKTTNYTEALFDVPFAQLTGLRLDKAFLGSTLYAQLGGVEVRVPLVTERIHTLLQAIGQLPHAQRQGTPAAPITASATDPTGALCASHQLHAQDLRPQILLRLIHARAQREPHTATLGRALTDRVALFDRMLRYGRAMQRGFWLSVLPPETVTALCNAMLGGAIRHWTEGEYQLGEFLPGASQQPLLGSSAVNALGIASLLVTGVGWMRLPGMQSPTLRGLRVVVGGHPLGSGVQLLGTDGGPFQPLSVFQHEGVAGMLDALTRIESRVLLGWALLGADQSPDAIAAMPMEAFGAGVEHALGGPTDVRAFFARGG